MSGWRRTFTALRHRDFALLTASALPHMVSIQMMMVAFGYLAYELTRSATALGLMGLAWGIPMLCLSLVGGVAADRFPRRAILIVTQGTIGVVALANAVLVVTGHIQLWHLFVAALVQGTAFAFNMPARQAMIADLVGREDLANALALTNANMNMTRVFGPALAGFLIAWPLVGIGGVFVVMASMYVIVIALMFRIQGGRERAGTGRGSGLEQLVEGLRFIRGSAELRRLLTLGFVPMFLGMHYQMLMPAFALGLFDSGPEGLGLMNMSTGLGALVGTMALAAIGNVGWKERLQTGLGVAFGVALCAFGLAPTFVVALLLLPLVGGCSAAYQALNNTLVMEHTPRELYGRVMSVYMMSMSLMPLSTVPFGRLADEIGARPTVAGSGALLAVMVAIVAFGFARAPGRRLETAAPSRLH